MKLDIDDYDISILGFVVDVYPTILESVKWTLTKSIMCLESDDRAFVYDHSDMAIPRRKGKTAGMIGNFWPPKTWNMQRWIKESVELMHLEDPTAHKTIFVISDNYDPKNAYQYEMGMNWDSKLDDDCEFVMCGVANCNPSFESLCEKHPRCRYIHHSDIQDLQRTIACVYQKQDLNSNYKKLNLKLLKEEYERIKSKEGDTCEADYERQIF